MRTIVRSLVAVAALASVVGVGTLLTTRLRAADAAPDSELQRDLQLAAASGLDLAGADAPVLQTVSALEAVPTSAPAPATRLRRDRTGRRALRTPETPTVRSAPDPTTVAASDDAPTVEEPAAAHDHDASEAADEGVALPRPVPVAVSFPSGGATGSGVGDEGQGRGGIGGALGGIIGVVIRGGGVDGDHCERHDGARRTRGVYSPQPGGIAIGSRFPMPSRGGVMHRGGGGSDRVTSRVSSRIGSRR